MSKKFKTIKSLKHTAKQSIKIGDKYAKISLDGVNIPSARIANQAYGNAIRASIGLILHKGL